MLTPDEIRKIQETVGLDEHKGACCVEALKIVQGQRGWVSDESLMDIASLLGMNPSQVDGLATFYNRIFRKPVGRHVIFLCDNVSCWIMGSDSIRDHLTRKLGVGFGQTTADGEFTLLPTACLGVCDHAPAMMIDDDLHLDLDGEKVDRILDQYRRERGK